MKVCLDSWTVLAWLDGEEPARSRTDEVLPYRPVISWVNAVEVYHRVEREHGRVEADDALARLRQDLEFELPGVVRIVETALLKARLPMALADCFAVATAAGRGLPLLTSRPGDPAAIRSAV